jgi:hypothetical protein
MLRPSSSRSTLAAAALALAAIGSVTASASPRASACDAYCGGYGFAPSYYYAPPVYAYAQPVVAYAAPPVYAYSYFPSGYAANLYAYAYGPTYFDSYYTTRINIFRGPRWGYSAAYYTSPGGIYGGYRRRARIYRGCGPRFRCGRPYRAYVRGPIIRGARRW